MTVYIAGRQTGKTIYLIRMSAKTGAVIVAPTYQMVSYIDQMARKLGLKIPPLFQMDRRRGWLLWGERRRDILLYSGW